MTEFHARRQYEKYQKKISAAGITDILAKEQPVIEKLTGPLNRVSEDVKLFFSILKDYVNGSYREIPWRAIAGIAGTSLYIFIPTDVIPDWIAILGLTDDVSVVMFCMKSIDAELQKYNSWKKTHSDEQNEEKKMIEITVKVNCTDFESLSEKIIPLIFNSTEKKEKKTFKDRLMLLAKKPAECIIPKIAGKRQQGKNEDSAVNLAEKYKNQIIPALNKLAEKNDIAVTVEDFAAEKI